MDEKSLNRPEGHGSSNSRRKSREGTYETDYNFDSSNDYVVPKSTKYRRELSRDICDYRNSFDYFESDHSTEDRDEIKHIDIKRASWLKGMRLSDNPWIQLNNEIISFYNSYGPTKTQKRITEKLFQTISNLIKKYNPNHIVAMYGSRATNLYIPSSDLDIAVFCEIQKYSRKRSKCKYRKSIGDFEFYQEEWNKGQSKIELEQICKVLSKEKCFYKTETITTAKVPIIRLIDKKTSLKVDISINQKDGVAAVNLIKQYCKLYPQMKIIFFILKCLLKGKGLNETYTGVISYFQESYKNEENENLLVSEHLLNILELYGINFNYQYVGISVRNGGSYFPRPDVGGFYDVITKINNPILYLENPQDTNINLGKIIKKMNEVISVFKHAYMTLKYNTRADKSMLKSIISESINFRQI